MYLCARVLGSTPLPGSPSIEKLLYGGAYLLYITQKPPPSVSLREVVSGRCPDVYTLSLWLHNSFCPLFPSLSLCLSPFVGFKPIYL